MEAKTATWTKMQAHVDLLRLAWFAVLRKADIRELQFVRLLNEMGRGTLWYRRGHSLQMEGGLPQELRDFGTTPLAWGGQYELHTGMLPGVFRVATLPYLVAFAQGYWMPVLL